MPQCCAVPMCTKKKGGHKFPSDKVMLRKWLIAIRRDKFQPSKHSRVCKNHFGSEDYEMPKDSIQSNPNPKLKKNAVPSIFSWTKKKSDQCHERTQRALNRHMKKTNAASPSEEIDEMELDVTHEVELDCSHKSVETQCSLCDCNQPKRSLQNESIKHKFCIENLKDKPNQIQFYTGFDDYDHFMLVFSLFGNDVNNLMYYPHQNVSRRDRSLTPCNEFLLSLTKLRQNKCNIELSFMFEICETTVCNIFITWINYLYCKFKDFNVWATQDTLNRNLMLRGKSNPCTIIIDCTEVKIEKPKNPVSQQLTYSTYKSANTLKVLVGISASGCVTFVSDAYGGSISDRELFEKCGIINELQEGDKILADRGFNIQDLVCHKNISVITPEFLKQSNQFTPHQLRISKKVSSNRIHIERVIGLGKTYKILAGKLRSTLVPLGNRIIYVCFMLTNLRCNIL